MMIGAGGAEGCAPARVDPVAGFLPTADAIVRRILEQIAVP